MKRRSMLMRLLGLCGFAAPGLNAVADMIGKSNGPGWIGLAIVGQHPQPKLWYPPRRKVERLRNDGLHEIKWEEIEPDDWVLITDYNELGRPYNQEAFVALSRPVGDVDPVGVPVTCEPIALSRFWGMAKSMDQHRIAQMVDRKWESVTDAHWHHGYMTPDTCVVIEESDCNVIA